MTSQRTSIEVNVTIEKVGQLYAAECVELGTASCGDSLEEAMDNIAEALALHLSTLQHLGDMERVFREKGIVAIKSATPEAGRFDASLLVPVPA